LTVCFKFDDIDQLFILFDLTPHNLLLYVYDNNITHHCILSGNDFNLLEIYITRYNTQFMGLAILIIVE